MEKEVDLFVDNLKNYLKEAEKYKYSQFIIDRDINEMCSNFYDTASDEGYEFGKDASREDAYDNGYEDGVEDGRREAEETNIRDTAREIWEFANKFFVRDEEGFQPALREMIENRYNMIL